MHDSALDLHGRGAAGRVAHVEVLGGVTWQVDIKFSRFGLTCVIMPWPTESVRRVLLVSHSVAQTFIY